VPGSFLFQMRRGRRTDSWQPPCLEIGTLLPAGHVSRFSAALPWLMPEDLPYFLSCFAAGLCCHSLEEAEIIDRLSRFVTDTEFYASAVQAALDQELNLAVFRRCFTALIAIAEDELLPLN